MRISTTMSSRESVDALEAAAARRRAAGAAWHSPAPAEAEPSEDTEPSAEASPPAEAEPSADAELSEASAEPAEPRAASPATAEVEPHADSEAEPRAEDTFDWNATPGPAKYAAFMDAFPPEKYCSLAYPRKTK